MSLIEKSLYLWVNKKIYLSLKKLSELCKDYIVQMLTKLGLSVINSFGCCVALKWPLKLMRGVSEIVLPNVVTKKGSALYAFCSFGPRILCKSWWNLLNWLAYELFVARPCDRLKLNTMILKERKKERTSPKEFSASKCDVGNWIFSKS